MDIQIYETNNGGDVIKIPGNLSVIKGFGNMPYLAMFGGNIEQDTPPSRVATEQAFDWWGNDLILGNTPTAQFNSKTERILNQIALNSAARIKIQEAVNYDLDFMKEFAEINTDVQIIATDKVQISITIKSTTKERDFIYIWDATNKTVGPVNGNVWDYTFDESFGS